MSVILGSVVLALTLTWPLGLHLGDATPSRWGDSKITAWVLAWDAHALAHNPTGLFQAPLFHPEADTLAYADNLIALGIFAAPISWVTGNIYVAHNVTVIASIAFSALAAFLLAFELTGRFAPAVIGGAAFASSPYWFGPIVNTSHLPILAAGWMPMACFAAIRWWRTQRARWLALLALSFTMATLTSWHQATFLVVALGILAVGLVIKRRPPHLARAVASAFLAASVTAAIIVPFALPYRRAQQRDPGYTRTLAQAASISAHPSSYLAAPETNIVYGDVTARWRARQRSLETRLFPGITVVLLAAVGIGATARARGRRALPLTFLAIAASGILLAMGTATGGFRSHLPWRWLYEHVLLFRSIRAPARAHLLTVLGLAALAALGAKVATARLRRFETLAALVLTAIVVAEGASIPLRLGTAPKPARIYETLADRPGAILELPMTYQVKGDWSDAYRARDLDYMLAGVAHWRPMVNGALGYTPASYFDIAGIAARLPASSALTSLRKLGVRTLVLHANDGAGTPWEDLDERLARAGILVLATDGDIVIYDLGSADA